MQRRDGSMFDAAVNFDGRYNEAGEMVGVQGNVRDITEQKIAEQRFRQHSNEFAHASRISTAGELASGLAHELNQPLYAISNYAAACRSIVAKRGPDEEQNIREWTQKICEQATRASAIIRRMTNFIRKAEPLPTEFSVHELIEEVLRFVEVETRRHQIRIDYQCDIPALKIVADRILIEQVLVNLIRNGVEAMSDAPVNRRQLTILTTQCDDGDISISVQDQGRGVDANSIERLFEPFYTTKPEGLGLGLAISRSIIESHQGKMWAQSGDTSGITFYIRLPQLLPLAPPPDSD
jgi:C4-dicarboxylate-specific signal transduction histidine kinase